jgi:hypothetical protein
LKGGAVKKNGGQYGRMPQLRRQRAAPAPSTPGGRAAPGGERKRAGCASGPACRCSSRPRAPLSRRAHWPQSLALVLLAAGRRGGSSEGVRDPQVARERRLPIGHWPATHRQAAGLLPVASCSCFCPSNRKKAAAAAGICDLYPHSGEERRHPESARRGAPNQGISAGRPGLLSQLLFPGPAPHGGVSGRERGRGRTAGHVRRYVIHWPHLMATGHL